MQIEAGNSVMIMLLKSSFVFLTSDHMFLRVISKIVTFVQNIYFQFHYFLFHLFSINISIS